MWTGCEATQWGQLLNLFALTVVNGRKKERARARETRVYVLTVFNEFPRPTHRIKAFFYGEHNANVYMNGGRTANPK